MHVCQVRDILEPYRYKIEYFRINPCADPVRNVLEKKSLFVLPKRDTLCHFEYVEFADELVDRLDRSIVSKDCTVEIRSGKYTCEGSKCTPSFIPHYLAIRSDLPESEAYKSVEESFRQRQLAEIFFSPPYYSEISVTALPNRAALNMYLSKAAFSQPSASEIPYRF
ncbi:MAG: hypothetical protein HGA85_00410 [Nanoarchaeota archaeon]|nr:hypothetical protein [Nanoarchaeota archaeon]